jgi:Na+/proline symporter
MRAYRPDLLSGDEQFILPTFVRDYTPQWVQLLFFGALLSAILSTASGALLAPAAIMGENLLRNLFPNTIKNNLLRYTRLSVISLAAVSLLLGISRNNIFELVSESSALSLVSLFVPMVAGLYFRRSPALAALVSMPVGFVVWLLALTFQTDINPILYGLVASGVSYALTAGVYRYWRRKTLRAHKRARAARRRKRHSIM